MRFAFPQGLVVADQGADDGQHHAGDDQRRADGAGHHHAAGGGAGGGAGHLHGVAVLERVAKGDHATDDAQRAGGLAQAGDDAALGDELGAGHPRVDLDAGAAEVGRSADDGLAVTGVERAVQVEHRGGQPQPGADADEGTDVGTQARGQVVRADRRDELVEGGDAGEGGGDVVVLLDGLQQAQGAADRAEARLRPLLLVLQRGRFVEGLLLAGLRGGVALCVEAVDAAMDNGSVESCKSLCASKPLTAAMEDGSVGSWESQAIPRTGARRRSMRHWPHLPPGRLGLQGAGQSRKRRSTPHEYRWRSMAPSSGIQPPRPSGRKVSVRSNRSSWS